MDKRNAKKVNAQNGVADAKADHNAFSKRVNNEINKMKAETLREYAMKMINPQTNLGQVFAVIRTAEAGVNSLEHRDQLKAIFTDSTEAKSGRMSKAHIRPKPKLEPNFNMHPRDLNPCI